MVLRVLKVVKGIVAKVLLVEGFLCPTRIDANCFESILVKNYGGRDEILGEADTLSSPLLLEG